MNTYQDDEIPKHRKKGSKRPWKVTWTYIGPKTYTKRNVKTGEVTTHLIEEDFFYRSLYQPWVQRYKTEKSARQALEAWENGSLMKWKSKDKWKAEVSFDESR